MCAMAQEQYRRDCKFYDDVSDPAVQKFLTDSAKTGDRTVELPNNATVAIGPGSFDTTDLFGAGSGCIQDMTIMVWGWSQTIPFSSVCPQLVMLGNVLMLVSFALAARIVSRG